MIGRRLVIIGHGMVSQRFLEIITAAALPVSVTVLCEEAHPAYDRVHLSSYFTGKAAAELSLVPEGFLERFGVDLLVGHAASAIDRTTQVVHSAYGHAIGYDILVLATGSRAFVPDVPGRDRPGCHVYRTLTDLDGIRSSATAARTGVVVGGGLLGLEAAKALCDLGLDTHVVEFAPRLMAQQVDAAGGAVLRRKIEELGVRVHAARNTTSITDGRSARHCMTFADGGTLEADVVVFSAGIRPRDELARAAGLEVAERGGVVIDEGCRTSDPKVYAIGECAAWHGRTFGLVAPGYEMARVAAARIAGDSDAAFRGADMSTKLKLLGVDVASIGDAHAATPGACVYAFTDERRGLYKKLVVSTDAKELLGAILVGDAAEYGALLLMKQSGAPLPEHPEELLLGSRAGAQSTPESGLAALPATAQICSCNNVSKGAICTAIDGGCTTVGALKKQTRAATSCGGCAPLVSQILHAELKRKGVKLDGSLCEHFAYSRQQLFHLVRIGELRSFEAVLARHGRGHGCDICKPTVASILASCWNEFVLAPDKAPLQDTNDYFLANMQKDGTYSVVPRVPGGEITPQRLATLATLAQKFGLYVKITGAQRIDLLGARVHQLPLIWRELIAAGFESGHAYGKAVRTVKSCVGSTWCRYGVQDSVGLAIELENRYKGLRAPHKIKLGVSGCTRECAEAQSKDVGVIATERGWNLYVCGNGGMKPRHAELLAADLDKQTLIRYIDRFLMFYVRTADRLQRTATWRDNLEGGLDYLKQVVCDDKLGIAQELETDMARVVASYVCEWRTAVESPITLRRFRHFVNSDAVDDSVRFVSERGQPRPENTQERSRRLEEAGA
jgi:nitrite reductase (NADH) large subunit